MGVEERYTSWDNHYPIKNITTNLQSTKVCDPGSPALTADENGLDTTFTSGTLLLHLTQVFQRAVLSPRISLRLTLVQNSYSTQFTFVFLKPVKLVGRQPSVQMKLRG